MTCLGLQIDLPGTPVIVPSHIAATLQRPAIRQDIESLKTFDNRAASRSCAMNFRTVDAVKDEAEKLLFTGKEVGEQFCEVLNRPFP